MGPAQVAQAHTCPYGQALCVWPIWVQAQMVLGPPQKHQTAPKLVQLEMNALYIYIYIVYFLYFVVVAHHAGAWLTNTHIIMFFRMLCVVMFGSA